MLQLAFEADGKREGCCMEPSTLNSRRVQAGALGGGKRCVCGGSSKAQRVPRELPRHLVGQMPGSQGQAGSGWCGDSRPAPGAR